MGLLFTNSIFDEMSLRQRIDPVLKREAKNSRVASSVNIPLKF